jgi:hypothetical protein
VLAAVGVGVSLSISLPFLDLSRAPSPGSFFFASMARPFNIDGLQARLMHARATERFVPLVETSEPSWTPAFNACHSNVDWWVQRHAGFRAVRGWLVFDFSRASTELIEVVRFVAHSVLQGPDETLIDITPTLAKRRYPFIVHPGGSNEYAQIVQGQGIAYVDCRR